MRKEGGRYGEGWRKVCGLVCGRREECIRKEGGRYVERGRKICGKSEEDMRKVEEGMRKGGKKECGKEGGRYAGRREEGMQK
jgi:hypothetical protein